MRQLTLALLCAAPLFSQPVTVDGDWVAVTPFFDMKNYNRLALHQQGSELTGAAGNLKLAGAIHGRDIEMEGKDERGATASFKGVVANGEITGDAKLHGDPMKFRAYRPIARPADEPRRRKFEPTEFHRYFSGAIAPVLHIFPGDTVETWSVDPGGYDPK